MTIPMPEPVACRSKDQPYLFGLSAPTGSSERWDDLITTTQAEAYKDACVREALEKAANALTNPMYIEATLNNFTWVSQGNYERAYLILQDAERMVRALIPPLPGPVEP